MTEKKIDPTPFEALAKLTATGLGPFGRIGTVWAEGMAELGGEMLHFLSERAQRDVNTQQRLLHCTNLDELRQIQSEFLQSAINDYTAETGRIVEMTEDMMEKIGLPKPD